MTASTLVVPLPWLSPPLSLNDREHWRPKAAKVRAARTEARWAIRAVRLPRLPAAEVVLVWRVRDWRRRDLDNLTATLKPCIDALVEANSGLKTADQVENWHEVEELMSDKTSQTEALGWFDPKRMQNDYELVKTYLGIDKPFDVTKYYTNSFLDKSIKMKAIKFEG